MSNSEEFFEKVERLERQVQVLQETKDAIVVSAGIIKGMNREMKKRLDQLENMVSKYKARYGALK